MGLVAHAFDERKLAPLQGHLAIGHVRYSTTGSSTWGNAQPCYREIGDAGFALGHNGNLVSTDTLAAEAGILPGTVANDSDLVAELIEHAMAPDGHGRSDGRDLERALLEVLPRLQGAFSLVLMDDSHVIGVRDPNGFRPLCLGLTPPIVRRASGMSLSETIEDAVRWEVEARRIPSISYALVDRDAVLATGHVARAGTTAPTDANLFRIASLTKMMTAIAVMQLARSGRLQLDDDVADHLPVARGATLRQLLSHTSGLTREAAIGHYLDDHAPPLAETVRSLAAFPRKVEPGIYRYSNAGFALLGAVVEARGGGSRYADVVRERIFDPSGMSDTTVGFDDAAQGRLVAAQMWSFDGDRPAPIFNLGGESAGNVVSSLGDMGRFARALLSDDLLPRAALEEMWRVPGGKGYGLGFAVDRLDGRRTVGHGGVVYGYASLLTALPDDGLAVVLFSTMDMTNQVLNRLGAYALRLALAERGGGATPQPPVRTEPAPGRGLAGDYWRADGSDRIELREREDGLYLLENGVPLEIRADGDALVVDGRLQGQDNEGGFLGLDVTADGLRWRGETWTAVPPVPVAPPADLVPHLGTYGPAFLPVQLMFRDGKLRGLAEGLAAHTCEPLGGNRYVMRGWLLDDEVLEVGLIRNGRPANKVGEVIFEKLG